MLMETANPYKSLEDIFPVAKQLGPEADHPNPPTSLDNN
jgi:hypothetical protein